MSLKIKITKKAKEGSLLVSLDGSLDTEAAPELEEKVNAALDPKVKGVILDMEKLAYISSLGFAALFRIKLPLEKNGGKLVIANLQPNVKKIFDAVKAIPKGIFATFEEADQYLDKYISFINAEDDKKE